VGGDQEKKVCRSAEGIKGTSVRRVSDLEGTQLTFKKEEEDVPHKTREPAYQERREAGRKTLREKKDGTPSMEEGKMVCPSK